jgi:hypothetical protein
MQLPCRQHAVSSATGQRPTTCGSGINTIVISNVVRIIGITKYAITINISITIVMSLLQPLTTGSKSSTAAGLTCCCWHAAAATDTAADFLLLLLLLLLQALRTG